MSHVKTMSRLCGACLDETAPVAKLRQTDELIWVCPHCSYLELSGIDDDSALLAPNEVRLREIMGIKILGDKLRAHQRSIRLAQPEPDLSSAELDPQPWHHAFWSAIKTTWDALCLLVWLLWRGI